MYREELLAGRGVGCVATRDIEEGELIISEEPALLLGPDEKKRGVSITGGNMHCEYAPAKKRKTCLEANVSCQEANLSCQEAYVICEEAYVL